VLAKIIAKNTHGGLWMDDELCTAKAIYFCVLGALKEDERKNKCGV
jgi:hypothetical protein